AVELPSHVAHIVAFDCGRAGERVLDSEEIIHGVGITQLRVYPGDVRAKGLRSVSLIESNRAEEPCGSRKLERILSGLTEAIDRQQRSRLPRCRDDHIDGRRVVTPAIQLRRQSVIEEAGAAAYREPSGLTGIP